MAAGIEREDFWTVGNLLGEAVAFRPTLKNSRDVIRHLHGVESSHVESVPIKEVFQGKTVWDGIVEVFDLHGPSERLKRLYAWAYETDNPKKPRRHVTVLHLGPPLTSPLLGAVRAAIICRSLETMKQQPKKARKVGRPRMPKGEAKGQHCACQIQSRRPESNYRSEAKD